MSGEAPRGRSFVKTLSESEWKRVVFERLDRKNLQRVIAEQEKDLRKLRAVVRQLSPKHPVLDETFDPDDDGDEAA